MKKGMSGLLVLTLLAGCTTNPTTTTPTASSTPIPSEEPKKQAVVWTCAPTLELDGVEMMTIGPFAEYMTGSIMERTGYPQEWDDIKFVENADNYTSDAIVVIKGTQWGIYNYEGKTLFPIEYDVKDNGETIFYANGTAKFIYTEMVNDHYKVFSDDFGTVEDSSEPYGVGGVYPGNVIVDDVFMSADGGTPAYTYGHRTLVNEADAQGNRTAECYQVDGEDHVGAKIPGYPLNYYANGFYAITEDSEHKGKIAIVSANTEKCITEFVYDDAKFFEDGYMPVKKNGKWGFINDEGKEVTDFIFDDASTLYQGKAYVSNNGVYGVLDLKTTLNQNIPVTMETCYQTNTTKE